MLCYLLLNLILPSNCMQMHTHSICMHMCYEYASYCILTAMHTTFIMCTHVYTFILYDACIYTVQCIHLYCTMHTFILYNAHINSVSVISPPFLISPQMLMCTLRRASILVRKSLTARIRWSMPWWWTGSTMSTSRLL